MPEAQRADSGLWGQGVFHSLGESALIPSFVVVAQKHQPILRQYVVYLLQKRSQIFFEAEDAVGTPAKRGGIADHHVKLPASLGAPAKKVAGVGRPEFVALCVDSVKGEIGARPVYERSAQVYADHLMSAAQSGVEAKAARIGKQVEDAAIGRLVS